MNINLDPNSQTDYKRFLQIKELPQYRFVGRTAIVPDEYADRIGVKSAGIADSTYTPVDGLFDYQEGIAAMAIRKHKYAVFARCGLGKTLILLEFVKHAAKLLPTRNLLIVSPLMVVEQTIEEAKLFYGDSLQIEHVPARRLAAWTASATGIGITNYDALHDEIPQGRLGCLVLDESSMLKSMYGKWGQECIRLGRGLDWKLALTGTPAPNDRIEYANHAIFLDHYPTQNAFLSRFFVNRGQTDNRWELKPHALRPFYLALSHWCIFLSNPATYGWKDNADTIPPVHVHIEKISMTKSQHAAIQDKTQTLFPDRGGGITSRTTLARIGKGCGGIESRKPQYIVDMLDRWPDESTIIWCLHNEEQERLAAMLPEAANVSGDTPLDERKKLVAEFQTGKRRTLITKGKILGFGLNLQICTRQIFSGLQDSYETFHQCVSRSNRVGSTKPLNVYIPITDIEVPMIETVIRKAKRVEADTLEQERLFKDVAWRS